MRCILIVVGYSGVAYAFLFLLSIFGLNESRAATFTAEACKDFDAITEEIIQLELSGVRWQGGASPCLKQSAFKAVLAVPKKITDPSLLDPELLLPKGRSVRVITKKWLDVGGFDVKFAYIAKKDGKETPVEDRLTYTLHYGSDREKKGCASISEDPKRFVMRAECVKD